MYSHAPHDAAPVTRSAMGGFFLILANAEICFLLLPLGAQEAYGRLVFQIQK